MTAVNRKQNNGNIFLDVFARVWALWGILSFVISFLIFFLPSMCAYLFKDEKKGQAYFISVSRYWMNVWLFLIGCPVKVTGKEHFKKGHTYVIVYNHNALLDVPLSAPYVPGANKTIAKASFAKVPIFGWFYSRGSVLVDRKNERSRVKSFDQMRRTLHDGMHMCIYPEGTRNRTNEPMKPFYDGAFKLAVDTKKEIIPCVIMGTKKAMPIHKKFYLIPTRLRMQFLEAVPSENENSKELKQQVYDKMLATYVAYENR
ncbi:MAG: 1-acyl-sn-glycerol-3-phosphate acyltransferase [Sphingobacteriales bacterium]|nr:MAG: 1-acyl-sn-glycerol-3-phosphate acyltransferase [Sphingobacteriales bacterium]